MGARELVVRSSSSKLKAIESRTIEGDPTTKVKGSTKQDTHACLSSVL